MKKDGNVEQYYFYHDNLIMLVVRKLLKSRVSIKYARPISEMQKNSKSQKSLTKI